MHQKLRDTLSKYINIILVGGGTGGHIQPILNIVEQLPDRDLIWIGGKNSTEEMAAKTAKIPFEHISTLKLSTTRSPKVFLYPFILLHGIFEARKILTSRSSSLAPAQGLCIFSKGGPGSVAVCLAGWSLGIPVYIHESDTVPGRSNQLLGKIATKIFLGFDSAKKYFDSRKCETIGQILHPIFSCQHSNIPTFQLSNTPTFQPSISWKTQKKHLLVICGSQGSKVIFEEILLHLEEIMVTYEIILVLGKLNTDMRRSFEKKIQPSNIPTFQHSNIPTLQRSITLLDWISQEDLAHLIRDTTIAITRGSATTLAELTAFYSSNTPTLQHSNPSTLQPFNTPTLIIIPLPYSAGNHQYWNAVEYKKHGHTVLEQKNLTQLIPLLIQLGKIQKT